jgi:elongation factor 1-beta
MARVIVTLKIMPQGPEIDLNILEEKSKAIVVDFGGTIMNIEKQPIGFGIVALMVKFNMDEAKGDIEPLEKLVATVEGVESVEVAAISRAFG